jgi:hypothetical protein
MLFILINLMNKKLSQCRWHNLSNLYLDNIEIIKIQIQSEVQAVNGSASFSGNISHCCHYVTII